MGANIVEFELDGKMTAEAVKAEVLLRIEDSKLESGNSYSGQIGMADGVITHNAIMDGYNEVVDYMEDLLEKWGPAVAVRYHADADEMLWLVRCICAE